MRIAIIFAMEKELDLFAKQITQIRTQKHNHLTLYLGQYKNLELCLSVSGMGKVNATLCFANLVQTFKPDLVINIGVSGGLDSSLKVGDIVVATELVYHDVWCGEPCKLGQIQNLPPRYTTTHTDLLFQYPQGLLISGDWFMTEPEKLNAVKKEFPEALAVDMESGAIAQCCYLYQIPLMVIRQISDVVGSENEQAVYNAFWQNASEQSTALLDELLDKLNSLS